MLNVHINIFLTQSGNQTPSHAGCIIQPFFVHLESPGLDLYPWSQLYCSILLSLYTVFSLVDPCGISGERHCISARKNRQTCKHVASF